MRMRFPVEDEQAFYARRDALGEQFAAWLNAQKVPGDPNDAGLLMDWKFGYADGALDTWAVADVGEFLFGWCPRKLSAAPDGCAEIPGSVAAFVEFLAHTGLLARGSDLPSQVRSYCERNTARFVREMGDPANFGMAKSLFGAVGGLKSGADRSPEGLAAPPPAATRASQPARQRRGEAREAPARDQTKHPGPASGRPPSTALGRRT